MRALASASVILPWALNAQQTSTTCEISAHGYEANYGSTTVDCCNAIGALYNSNSISANICLSDQFAGTVCWQLARADFSALAEEWGDDEFVNQQTVAQIDQMCSASTTTTYLL